MIKSKNIALVGAGFMGSALIRGLVNSKTASPERIFAFDSDQETLEALSGQLGVKAAGDNEEAVKNADIVILAVKPQIVADVARSFSGEIDGEKLVISIAAGVTIKSLEAMFKPGSRIIRAMPNMPAMVGEAATAICAGTAVEKEDIGIARQIFDAVGKTVVVDESAMDAVTGLSGSGPAYVFTFLEALTEAGLSCGLSREVSEKLAGQTLYGAARLAMETGASPAKLRERITSPGGTTLAGLASLKSEGFSDIVQNAVKAAMKRSKELGS